MRNMKEVEELNRNKRKIEKELIAHQASEECTGKVDCNECLSLQSSIEKFKSFFILE